MLFTNNYHESIPPKLTRYFKESGEMKIDLWNAFVDSGLTGVTDDDCSVIPRILPASYLPVIVRASKDIMFFLMRLISLPNNELTAILPPTPVTDYLIKELGILKHRPPRLTGSLRLDMAVVGKPSAENPPKIFEVNEIGFDGVGRSSFIQETILKLIPGLDGKVICLDTAGNEAKNMRRLGKNIARIQYDGYNWEEEVVVAKAREYGMEIRLVSPTQFDIEVDDECKLLERERIHLKYGKIFVGKDPRPPDATQIAYSFSLSDYKESPKLFRDLIRSKTPQYSPFFTGLIAPKTVLVLMSDRALVKKLAGAACAERIKETVLPAFLLKGREDETRRRASDTVVKHADGMGGAMDHIGNESKSALKRIRKRDRSYWVVQERVHMNTIDVHGILSRKRRVLADLGVYINYDWNGREFTNLNVGGLITRATNRSFKINVSGGGIQVPVMFERES